MPLYKPKNPRELASDSLAKAAQSFSSMGKGNKTETEIHKTAGGAVTAGIGMGAAGATIGSTVGASTAAGASVGGYWGAAIGFVVGLGTYLLS